MIEKARLLQESITHPKTDFELVAIKKLTFNCSINDAGSHNFLAYEKKATNTVLTVFEQNFALENFGLHF